MGFFDTFISSKKNMPKTWENLEDIKTLDQIITDSMDHPVIIYKHSTTCSLNSVKIKELTNSWGDLSTEKKMDFYYLDLLAYRSISNEIEEKFGVRHESPQLLVFNKGKITHHTSHMGVTIDFLNNALTSSL